MCGTAESESICNLNFGTEQQVTFQKVGSIYNAANTGIIISSNLVGSNYFTLSCYSVFL